MSDHVVDGIQRATFGAVPVEAVDDWLRQHVRDRLGTDLAEVELRSGRVSAVFGTRTADGERVVVKVQREHLDARRTASLAACTRAQALLAEAGYPCPVPLDGPAVTRGLTATVESWLDEGRRADAHEPATRSAVAGALARQLELLRALPDAVVDELRHPPAWVLHSSGPWPVPHDPVFDFTATPGGFAWLDRVAARAAQVLARPEARSAPRVVGHADWSCGNLRFTAGEGDDGAVRVVAAYDWDSLTVESEAFLAGMAAASCTQGGTGSDACPTPDEVAAFLADHEHHRGAAFTAAERTTAAAAATWALAYNARCLVDLGAVGLPHDAGSPLDALADGSERYLQLTW